MISYRYELYWYEIFHRYHVNKYRAISKNRDELVPEWKSYRYHVNTPLAEKVYITMQMRHALKHICVLYLYSTKSLEVHFSSLFPTDQDNEDQTDEQNDVEDEKTSDDVDEEDADDEKTSDAEDDANIEETADYSVDIPDDEETSDAEDKDADDFEDVGDSEDYLDEKETTDADDYSEDEEPTDDEAFSEDEETTEVEDFPEDNEIDFDGVDVADEIDAGNTICVVFTKGQHSKRQFCNLVTLIICPLSIVWFQIFVVSLIKSIFKTITGNRE